MKNRLFAILLTLILLLTITGCSASGAVRTLDAVEDRVENKLDAVEDTVERAIRQTAAPAATEAIPEAPAPAETAPAEMPPAETTTAAITKEDAEKIALEFAGFTADQVTRLWTEYEIDDRTPQYDVQFYNGDWEYEFEIHAETGEILSVDRDHKYD